MSALWARKRIRAAFRRRPLLGRRADDEARPAALSCGWPNCSASSRTSACSSATAPTGSCRARRTPGMTPGADPRAVRRVGARGHDRLGRAARLLAERGSSSRLSSARRVAVVPAGLRRRRPPREPRRVFLRAGVSPPGSSPFALDRLGLGLGHVDRRRARLGRRPAQAPPCAVRLGRDGRRRLLAAAAAARAAPRLLLRRRHRRPELASSRARGSASSAGASGTDASGVCPCLARRRPAAAPASSSGLARRGSRGASASSACAGSAVFGDGLDRLLVLDGFRFRFLFDVLFLDDGSASATLRLGLLRARGARRLLGLRLGRDRRRPRAAGRRRRATA